MSLNNNNNSCIYAHRGETFVTRNIHHCWRVSTIKMFWVQVTKERTETFCHNKNTSNHELQCNQYCEHPHTQTNDVWPLIVMQYRTSNMIGCCVFKIIHIYYCLCFSLLVVLAFHIYITIAILTCSFTILTCFKLI